MLPRGVVGLEVDRRSSSGLGNEFFLLLGGVVIVALRSGRLGDLSLSLVVDLRAALDDLWRGLSLDLGGSVSRSRSLSRSRSFSRSLVGMMDR